SGQARVVIIGIQNDISSQREYQAQLAYNVSHDTLTGLPQRAWKTSWLRAARLPTTMGAT
ncbi:MAG: hypothetical protein WED11_08550, partial [Natronospirillum sp.]